ncbi:MAG: ATP-binding cassette domain-containing protein [Denitrobacterium sp.]|jgi:molybdate transport system ATP-binding protein|nr:ATP-binding cassette domain-containing protein [Denitrobacterium sp.]
MSLELSIRKHLGSFDLDVDLTAGAGVVGLLGASGCGKTLTMRCIAGIETPDEGRIVVNDRVFFDSEAGVNLSPQERKTALLFQNYMLFPNFTVEGNVGAGIPKSVPADERKHIIDRELHRFDVTAFAKRYPHQLSGGQQQRVALARMLAANPCILMLDEPFSALDSHLKMMLEQNLSSLFDAFDGTIVYVSHDIDEALRFCDSIAVMERGHIVEIDQGREIVDAPHSKAALKLSGCKNVVDVKRTGDDTVFSPQWGVTLHIPSGVPDGTKALGVRASYLERASEPGENVFRMRVDRVSDSRFERSAQLAFLDREPGAEPEANDREMHFLHQHLFWRVTHRDEQGLPETGEELLVRIPSEKIYLVAE